MPLFADNDSLDLQDFLVHLCVGDPSPACIPPPTSPYPLPSPLWSDGALQTEVTHRPLAQRRMPNEENTRAPRAAKVSATDFFARVFWGTSVVGCGRG